MKKILSTRVLVKICVLTTILLVLIIYTFANCKDIPSIIHSIQVLSCFSSK